MAKRCGGFAPSCCPIYLVIVEMISKCWMMSGVLMNDRIMGIMGYRDEKMRIRWMGGVIGHILYRMLVLLVIK